MVNVEGEFKSEMGVTVLIQGRLEQQEVHPGGATIQCEKHVFELCIHAEEHSLLVPLIFARHHQTDHVIKNKAHSESSRLS